VKISVRIDTRRLRNVVEMMVRGMSGAGGDGNPIDMAFRQWAVRYRAAMQDRFDIFSKGGGDWAPLARSTILARQRQPLTRLRREYVAGALFNKATGHPLTEKEYARKYKAARGRIRRARAKATKSGTFGGKVSILRDTGTLMNTLSPTIAVPGQLEERVDSGILVGISGGSHPKSGGLTIGELAAYHHFGMGNNPTREILVRPDQELANKMAGDLARAVKTVMRSAGRE